MPACPPRNTPPPSPSPSSLASSSTFHARRALLSTAGGAALVAGLGAGLWVSLRNTQPAASVHPLSELTLPDVQGNKVSLSRWMHRPVLINFWATWCPPCTEEIPLLNSFYRQNATKDIQMLAIAADRQEAVQKFISRLPVDYPNFIANLEAIRLAHTLGNTSGGLPYSVVLAPSSALLFKKSGKLTADELKTVLSHLIV